MQEGLFNIVYCLVYLDKIWNQVNNGSLMVCVMYVNFYIAECSILLYSMDSDLTKIYLKARFVSGNPKL